MQPLAPSDAPSTRPVFAGASAPVADRTSVPAPERSTFDAALRVLLDEVDNLVWAQSSPLPMRRLRLAADAVRELHERDLARDAEDDHR